MKKSAIVALLSLSAATYAFEDDDLIALYDEEELISIATGTEKHIRFAPSVASVITHEEIKRIGARTLDEALESVPGLHVAKSFNRQDPIYSIRGIHTGQNPQVLLLVDGVRVQQLFTGARPFNFEMSTAIIERIEVIRGPGSALYGADAFAGVISVTTKVGAGIDEGTYGARVGSFDTYEAWVLQNADIGGVNLDFSLDYKSSNGDRDRVIQDDYQTSLLATGFGAQPSNAPGPLETGTEYWDLRIALTKDKFFSNIYYWKLIEAGLGSGGLQALDPVGRDKVDYFGIDVGVDAISLSDDLTYSVKTGVKIYDQDSQFQLAPPGTLFDNDGDFAAELYPDGVIGNPGFKESTAFLESVFNLTYFENHNLRMGFGGDYTELEATESKNFVVGAPTVLQETTGTSEIFIADVEREHYYAYLQDEWVVANDWQATLGVRYDHYNQFGESVNPRVALVWSTAHNLTTKFLWGRAFRAPSLGELFSQKNPALIGNSDLQPEEIETREIAFDYQLNKDINMRLSLFDYEIDKLIEVPFGSQASNGLGQDGHGFEAELSWELSEAFEIYTNYAWYKAESKSTDLEIPNAAQKTAHITGEWRIDDSRRISISGNWVADRERTVADPRDKIDDYFLTDIVYNSKSLFEGLDYAVIVRNVFDEDAREPSTPGILPTVPEVPDDYPEEGRSFTLEITYQVD